MAANKLTSNPQSRPVNRIAAPEKNAINRPEPITRNRVDGLQGFEPCLLETGGVRMLEVSVVSRAKTVNFPPDVWYLKAQASVWAAFFATRFACCCVWNSRRCLPIS